MSSPTALQKRKRGDAHEDAECSARGEARRHDDRKAAEDHGASLVPVKGASSSPKASNGGTRGLHFATESWTGRKPTNEDRSVCFVSGMAPLGPAFAIYDGHGGTFTADFLVGKLLKAVAASVRQQVGERKLQQLDASAALSRSESTRLAGIKQQIGFVSHQLEQLKQLVDTPSADETGGEQQDEMQVLHDELEEVIRDLAAEEQRIVEEVSQRTDYRCQWFDTQDAAIQRAFVDAFKHTDEQILRKNSSRDGSTALVLCFFGGDGAADDSSSEKTAQHGGYVDYRPAGFYALNLGDCRAVLCRREGAAVRLTSDHKPDRPDEKRRIEKAGGFVGTFAGIPRVYSAVGAGLAVQSELATYLAVSRAFGDRPLKTPSALVSCEPEVKRFEVQPGDSFVLMACDGVWDVLSDDDAVSIAHQHLQDPKAAANAVIKAAYMKGSADNLTATVIKFGENCAPARTGKATGPDDKLLRVDEDHEAHSGDTLIGQADDGAKGAADASLGSANANANANAGADDEIDMFSL